MISERSILCALIVAILAACTQLEMRTGEEGEAPVFESIEKAACNGSLPQYEVCAECDIAVDWSSAKEGLASARRAADARVQLTMANVDVLPNNAMRTLCDESLTQSKVASMFVIDVTGLTSVALGKEGLLPQLEDTENTTILVWQDSYAVRRAAVLSVSEKGSNSISLPY